MVKAGYSVIAGVDEVGAGCLAGPVYAAAVVLERPIRDSLIRDSKTLSADQRERAAVIIRKSATAWAIGTASAAEIDDLNIRQAAAVAMRRAVAQLTPAADYVLVDGLGLKGWDIPTKAIVKGESVSLSIAAASILAKIERDTVMAELDELYPGYGFAAHKGYGTKVHQEALRRLGPCPEHRRSFHVGGKKAEGKKVGLNDGQKAEGDKMKRELAEAEKAPDQKAEGDKMKRELAEAEKAPDQKAEGEKVESNEGKVKLRA